MMRQQNARRIRPLRSALEQAREFAMKCLLSC